MTFNVLGLAGVVHVFRNLITWKEWFTVACWWAIGFAASYGALDVSLPVRVAISGLLAWCLLLTSCVAVLSDRVAHNYELFEIADRELVRVSHLTDEQDEEIADLKSRLDRLELDA